MSDETFDLSATEVRALRLLNADDPTVKASLATLRRSVLKALRAQGLIDGGHRLTAAGVVVAESLYDS